jgi:hypothetical protein
MRPAQGERRDLRVIVNDAFYYCGLTSSDATMKTAVIETG